MLLTSFFFLHIADMDQIGEPPRTQNLEGFDLLFGTTEFFGGVLIVLVAVWLNHFRGGFAWNSDPGLEFNWHPLLMTIGLVFLYANGKKIFHFDLTAAKCCRGSVGNETVIIIFSLLKRKIINFRYLEDFHSHRRQCV